MNNVRAYRAAQEYYDALVPEDSPTWAESSEWANIHDGCVTGLIHHGKATFYGRTLVEADVLAIKVQKAVEDAMPGDFEWNVGQLMVALEADNFSEAKRLMRCLLGKDKIRDLAGDLVNAKEDEIYRLYVQEAA